MDAVTKQEAYRRHAVYYIDFLEHAESRLRGSEQAGILDQIEQESVQLYRIMEWTLESEPELALQMAGYLRSFWEIRGYYREGRDLIQRALAAANTSCSGKVLLKALIAGGNLAWVQGDYVEALSFFRRSLDLATERRDISVTLNNMGLIAWNQGDYATARDYFEQSLAIDRLEGDPAAIAMVLNNLGILASDQADYCTAQTYLEESLMLAERAHDSASIARTLNGLGVVAQMQNNFEIALKHHRRSLEIKRKMLNRRGEATSLHNMGLVLLMTSDLTTAKRHLVEALRIRADLQDQLGLIESLGGLAHLALNENVPERAVILWAAQTRLRLEIGAPIPADERKGHEECLAIACEKLTLSSFQHVWQQGQAMETYQAVAYALDTENKLQT